MKKKMMKSTLVVALIAAAAFGGVKTYGAYAGTSESDQLLSDNVEALGYDYDFDSPRMDEELEESPCDGHWEEIEYSYTDKYGNEQYYSSRTYVVDSYETICTRTGNIITEPCDRHDELDCNGRRKFI